MEVFEALALLWTSTTVSAVIPHSAMTRAALSWVPFEEAKVVAHSGTNGVPFRDGGVIDDASLVDYVDFFEQQRGPIQSSTHDHSRSYHVFRSPVLDLHVVPKRLVLKRSYTDDQNKPTNFIFRNSVHQKPVGSAWRSTNARRVARPSLWHR